MGASSDEKMHQRGTISHHVTISRAFWLATTEVTCGQYKSIVGELPTELRDEMLAMPQSALSLADRLPVRYVTWDEAVEFCRLLTDSERTESQHRIYRLPTEAEWEYACRAGSKGEFPFKWDDAHMHMAFEDEDTVNSKIAPFPVRTFRPNAWGLYDMNGNVSEWCQDWFDFDYYAKSPSIDPLCSTPIDIDDNCRCKRGGCWRSSWFACRSNDRGNCYPSWAVDSIGFRVVCESTGGANVSP